MRLPPGSPAQRSCGCLLGARLTSYALCPSLHAGVEIAEQLGLNYLFLSEFEELRSPLRSARDQGGGVHGNAILTKFDITDVQIVQHR